MAQRVVESEYDRKLLIRYIEQQKLPFTAEVVSGKHRTVEQNRLQRKWMTEIAEQIGGDTKPEEIRAYCKLHIGVPILRQESELFRERYDAIIKPLPYEHKLLAMMEPLDFPVTRVMTTKQKTAYLDAVYHEFTAKGIALTVPPDERFGPSRGEAA